MNVVVGAALVIGIALGAGGESQDQLAGRAFHFDNPDPAFAPGAGPLVCVDEAHNNYHTANGRYRPFADLLRGDGYWVEGPSLKAWSTPIQFHLNPSSLA